jgi:hypothetical protein
LTKGGFQADAEALWYVGDGRAEIRREPAPVSVSGSVRVRALYGAISRGTERLVSSGRVPESEHERMRGPNMGGALPFPVKYGYAVVGRVEDGPAELAGKTVFALHPHQTVFSVPADAVAPVPAAVPPQRAVLAANMETALNAVWDGAPGPADRIAIVGAGVVGALCAYLCARIPGTEVTLVDVEPGRAELAKALSANFALPDAAPVDCDLVIHASASAAGLTTALRLAGQEATVIELSWYGTNETPVALGGAFHSRRLRLISSQVGSIAPSHRPRWSYRRRLAAALDLLAEPAIDALLSAPTAFHDLPARLPDIFGDNSGLCPVIKYPAADMA